MYEIYSYIRINKLNENYIKEFESVFEYYYENSSKGQGMGLIIALIRIIFVGVLSIIGIVLNCISLNKKNK